MTKVRHGMQQIENVTTSLAHRRQTRRMLLLLAAFFIAPIAVVVGALQLGWLDGGVPTSHNGTRITPSVAVIELGIDWQTEVYHGTALLPHHVAEAWWLLYILPPQCTAQCLDTLAVQQAVVAQHALSSPSGKPQVRPLVVITDARDIGTHSFTLINDAFWVSARRTAMHHALSKGIKSTEQPAEAGLLYLMNPSGQLLLYYPPVDNAEQLLRSTEIVEDLARLR